MGGLEAGMAGLAYQPGLVLGPSRGGMPSIPNTANTTSEYKLQIQTQIQNSNTDTNTGTHTSTWTNTSQALC